MIPDWTVKFFSFVGLILGLIPMHYIAFIAHSGSFVVYIR